MFNIFKKINKNKKFVIILSAGRCGSSYLLNELNKIKGVNIYGENKNTFSKIINTIYSLEHTIEKAKFSHKISNIKDLDKYNKSHYINTEWYNNIPKLYKIINHLENCLNLYFKDNYKVRGFKEIRFFDKNSIKYLQYFEKKYDVYYIHLTRNIEDQSKSAFWASNPNAKEKINKINKNIEEILGTKKTYMRVDLSDISKNISIVQNFLDI